MRLEEPKVEFVNIDLESEICTTSGQGQDGSHCTNEAYSELSCSNAAPQLCE